MDWLQNLDVTLFRFINGRLINPIFDQVMPFLSGNAFFIPAVIALGLLVIYKFRARGAVFFILLALSVALTDGVICRTIKKTAGRDRPFITLPDARCLLGKGSSGSMPSSHAANWFAEPLPLAASNWFLNCTPSALLAFESGSFSATTAGPDEPNEPSTSAPPTRIRSIVAAPCVW